MQTTSIPDASITSLLSEREQKVLCPFAKCPPNSEIAVWIYLSEGTVRNFVNSILEKPGVDERPHAAILAIRYGLTNMSEP